MFDFMMVFAAMDGNRRNTLRKAVFHCACAFHGSADDGDLWLFACFQQSLDSFAVQQIGDRVCIIHVIDADIRKQRFAILVDPCGRDDPAIDIDGKSKVFATPFQARTRRT